MFAYLQFTVYYILSDRLWAAEEKDGFILPYASWVNHALLGKDWDCLAGRVSGREKAPGLQTALDSQGKTWSSDLRALNRVWVTQEFTENCQLESQFGRKLFAAVAGRR